MVAARRSPLAGLAPVLAAFALIAAACTGGGENSGQGSGGIDDASASTVATDRDPGVIDLGVFDAPSVDESLLSIDDDIRIGTLDNGLTYYLRSNDRPGGSLSLRLAVKAGGIDENPIGTGAAHFLEHMMFNGTEQFPGNSLDAALRRIGAEIGPDFNAFTNASETVYQLDVADQGGNADVAFDVLAQWAAAATIDPAEVRAEEPVVREELRIRDESGQGIVNVAFEQAYFAGTPYEGVNVSGTAASVRQLNDRDLRAFYDTWYRPDNMAVIAVGDRSLDDLEDKIVERFSDLEARGDLAPPVEVGDFALRTEPLVDVVIEPSFADSFISIDIPLRAWDPSTVGGNDVTLTEIMLGLMIDNRLSEGVDSGRLDLRRAGGGWFEFSDGLTYLGFNADADDLTAGTEELLTEIRGSVLNPFSEDELGRAADVIRSVVDNDVASYRTRQDGEFADELVTHFVGGGDLRSIGDRERETNDLLNSLSIDEVNEHYGWMLTSSAPIVLVVGPDENRVGTVEEIEGAVDRAIRSEVATFEDDVVEIEDLLEDPRPIDEIARRSLERNDGFELTFDNGARVLFTESDISEGQVSVVSSSPGGRSVLTDAQGSIGSLAVDIVAASGAGEWDQVQLRRYLADLDVSLSPYLADFSEGVSGQAASEDLDVLFELLHLQLTQPRIDSVPMRQRLEAASDRVARAELDSATAASIALSDGRTGGGSLAAAPTQPEIDTLTEADVLAIWEDRFSGLDDHVFVVVGDIDGDEVADLARTWIATLPAAEDSDEPTQPEPPGLVDERLSVGSGTSSGSYRLLSVGEVDETIENRVIAELATTIVNDRIFTVIREELGATYGGFALIEFSDPGDEIELMISIDGDPSRIGEIARTVTTELENLRSGAIPDEDFLEAVSILNAEYGFVNNGFLIESLFDEAEQPPERILSRQAQREALVGIGRSDVISFLAQVFTDTDRVEVRNVPR